MISHPKYIAYEATEAESGQSPVIEKIGVLSDNSKVQLHIRKFFEDYWSFQDSRMIHSSG